MNIVARNSLKCAKHTDEVAPSLGEKAPQCLESLGTGLFFLDLMASCAWGCRNQDHVVEYLGRCGSYAYAASMVTMTNL